MSVFACLMVGSAMASSSKLEPQERGPLLHGVFETRLAAPITSWDEGLPLGNGKLGALVWGEDNLIRISLDRGDLWDQRPAPELADPGWNYANMRKLVAEKNSKEISRLFDACYEQHDTPTKLPVGRLEVLLSKDLTAKEFHLDFKSAVAAVRSSGKPTECFVASDKPLIWLSIPSPAAKVKLRQPTAESGALKRLGYEAATETASENGISVLTQNTPEGKSFSIVYGVRSTLKGTELVATVTALESSSTAKDSAVKLVRDSLRSGFERAKRSHADYWKRFWKVSSVEIPRDPKIQHHYNFVKYLYGAGSRPGAPPMPLQGVWTADNGGLPPWKGDYHHDLNSQTTYIAYQTAGLWDEGRVFLDQQWDLLPRYRKFARDFYGVEGAVVPGVAALDGSPLGGWGMYSLSPTNSSWIAHLFYRHWRVTMDRGFLEKRAYPWCAEVGQAITKLLEPNEDGQWVLPLSSSPEIHDNSLRAWLKPNSNYDQALLVSHLKNLVEMAHELKKPVDEGVWLAWLGKVCGSTRPSPADFALDSSGKNFLFAKGEPFDASHRHHSHLMAIHPLGLWDPESPRDLEVAKSSLAATMAFGTKAWVGYSFSWIACHFARTGNGDEALKNLSTFVDAFVLRNGFHANGDQSGKGHSSFTYRPFTLEGNFLAMEAVHEMLLQSWDGQIRVFPAIPKTWHEAKFDRLRAEGGVEVSAHYREGRIASLSLKSDRGGQFVVRLPHEKPIKVGLVPHIWKRVR